MDDPSQEERSDLHKRKDREREIAAIRARLARLDLEKAELEATLTRLIAAQESRGNPPPIKDAPVTNASSPAAKVTLFGSLFRGREDVFPKRWDNTKTGKAGYAPACANEWSPRICGKPKVKCGDYPNRSFLPVTDEVLDGHLRGRHTIGVYPMLVDSAPTQSRRACSTHPDTELADDLRHGGGRISAHAMDFLRRRGDRDRAHLRHGDEWPSPVTATTFDIPGLNSGTMLSGGPIWRWMHPELTLAG